MCLLQPCAAVTLSNFFLHPPSNHRSCPAPLSAAPSDQSTATAETSLQWSGCRTDTFALLKGKALLSHTTHIARAPMPHERFSPACRGFARGAPASHIVSSGGGSSAEEDLRPLIAHHHHHSPGAILSLAELCQLALVAHWDKRPAAGGGGSGSGAARSTSFALQVVRTLPYELVSQVGARSLTIASSTSGATGHVFVRRVAVVLLKQSGSIAESANATTGCMTLPPGCQLVSRCIAHYRSIGSVIAQPWFPMPHIGRLHIWPRRAAQIGFGSCQLVSATVLSGCHT